MIQQYLAVLLIVVFALGGCTGKNKAVSDVSASAHSKSCASRAQITSGMDRMSHPEWLPYFLPDGTITKQFIAYDLTSGNFDGSFTNAFVKYTEPNGEVVIFDEYGPGCLYRQQFNAWLGGTGSFGFGPMKGAGECRLKYYFDNEKTPRLDISADEFFGGKNPSFYRSV